MKTAAALLLAALAAVANAVEFTNSAINPEPGKPFELTWSGAQGDVTINLKGGPSSNLRTIEELGSGLSTGSLTITLDAADFPSGTYAFEIVDSADPNNPNYSMQFAFAGTGEPITASGAPSGTPSPSASTSSSRSSSSTASASRATGDETGSSTTSDRPSRTSSADDEEESIPGAAGRVASPLALILVTVAAMAYFN